MSSSLDKSGKRSPRKKRRAPDSSMMSIACKRRSTRLQHSMSLHIPIDDSTMTGMNCFINLPRQMFNLTYLGTNETNPDTLEVLEVLKRKKWQVYIVGILYNFDYKQAQINALVRDLNSTFRTELSISSNELTYHSEVSIVENLNPTDHDKQALQITVTQFSDKEERLLYEGYLMSWCNPENTSKTLLPLLLCNGQKQYCTLVNRVLSDRYNVFISAFKLNQEEFQHIFTYCLIMLGQNEDHLVSFGFKIPPGTITFEVPSRHLLELWKEIHDEDSNEVSLDEVLLFHDALESFYETTFGIKLGSAHLQNTTVKTCFTLNVSGEIRSRSTSVIHVVLKYLNYLAVQKLKVKFLNRDSEKVSNSTI